MRSKPPPKRPPAPSLTYAEWRARAREKLAGPNLMREKRWMQLFITGAPPELAAHEANVLYGNSQARPARR
jgi:hypothetical protein